MNLLNRANTAYCAFSKEHTELHYLPWNKKIYVDIILNIDVILIICGLKTKELKSDYNSIKLLLRRYYYYFNIVKNTLIFVTALKFSIVVVKLNGNGILINWRAILQFISQDTFIIGTHAIYMVGTSV